MALSNIITSLPPAPFGIKWWHRLCPSTYSSCSKQEDNHFFGKFVFVQLIVYQETNIMPKKQEKSCSKVVSLLQVNVALIWPFLS